MAITNCLFSPTSENPHRFSVWCVLAKFSAKPHNYSQPRPLGVIKMNQYNLIFLRSNKMLLSRKKYSDWREIQDEYEDYMASLDFESIRDVEEYIKMDYKLTLDKARNEVNKLSGSPEDTIEIEI